MSRAAFRKQTERKLTQDDIELLVKINQEKAEARRTLREFSQAKLAEKFEVSLSTIGLYVGKDE